MSCTETPANQPLQPVPPHLVYPATAHVTNSPTLCYWQRPRNELHLPRNTTQHWCPQYMWRPGAMPIGGAAMCPRDVTQLEKCVRYA